MTFVLRELSHQLHFMKTVTPKFLFGSGSLRSIEIIKSRGSKKGSRISSCISVFVIFSPISILLLVKSKRFTISCIYSLQFTKTDTLFHEIELNVTIRIAIPTPSGIAIRIYRCLSSRLSFKVTKLNYE